MTQRSIASVELTHLAKGHSPFGQASLRREAAASTRPSRIGNTVRKEAQLLTKSLAEQQRNTTLSAKRMRADTKAPASPGFVAASAPVLTVIIVLAALLVAAAIFFITLVPGGSRQVSALETLDGIPYPILGEHAQVYEQLAHANLLLNQPALAQQITLSLDFVPHQIDSLSVAVRENAFWFSYTPVTIYQSTNEQDVTAGHQASVTIPLTNKFQDTNQSLDLMFFANGISQPPAAGESINDTTFWELTTLNARVSLVRPSRSQLRDYTRSIIKRERNL